MNDRCHDYGGSDGAITVAWERIGKLFTKQKKELFRLWQSGIERARAKQSGFFVLKEISIPFLA